tara:strand:+ start:392 stop:736 length:345 start_codon:yes stop_codon:yes gene_type:complete
MNYTWFFSALGVHPSADGQTDVVYDIHWRLGGDDGSGHSSFVYGSVECTHTAGDPFIPFADLTESEVQGWAITSLGDERVVGLKAEIDAMIEEKITPTTKLMTPPWQQGGGNGD